MITPRQIRAARSLLDWTQTDLATAASLHINAINKIENAMGIPRTSSLERIQAALETAGIRFRGQRGVEVKEDVFEMVRYEGADFLRRMIDDMLLVIRRADDEVMTCTPDERLFNLTDPKQNDRFYAHLRKIGFRERCITRKDYNLFINRAKGTYRWLPEKALGTITYVIYRDRVTFVNWQIRETLVIRSKSLSQTFADQFEFLWSSAKPFEGAS